jgi:NAD(P)-dependent dehydrogenase (short-subunit alcohol dehydrogenase family)
MATQLRGLEGKKVLITGAAKGQGFSHAKAFAEAGCDIAAIDITHPVDPDLYAVATPEMMDATVAAIEERGQRCVPLPCDIRDEDQVRTAVEKALEEFDGVIDVIVNNAGMAALDTVHGMRSHVMNAVIDTNLKGAMHVTKYAVDNMIGRRFGKIINISSAVTGSGHAMLSHYVASKHAINGLTASWAMELAEFNINVNAICPATIRPGEGQGSGMVLGLSKEMDMDPEDAYNHFSEMGNMPGDKWRAEPHHISDAVLFLASENAEMITGAIIPVDCGQMTR